jgi:hypothetical protein
MHQTTTFTTMTMAACADGPEVQQHLQLLASLVSNGSDGSGNPASETAGGTQRRIFQNSGNENRNANRSSINTDQTTPLVAGPIKYL